MLSVFKKFTLRLTNRILMNFLKRQKIRLVNKDFTIICNNCIAGVLLKDLGQKLNTPTVNLYFFAQDYLKFLENLEYYLAQEISFSYKSCYSSGLMTYPVGKIDDVEIQFLHYNTIQEASEKWNERKIRIKWDNLYVIGSDRDNSSLEIQNRFLSLPFKNKVFFSSRRHSSNEVIYFKEYRNRNQVGDLIKDGYGWYFHFDTIEWLNTGRIKRNAIISWLFTLNRRLKSKPLSY